MMAVAGSVAPFRHEAVLYPGDDGFLDRIGRFVREGVVAGEPTLVMTNARKIAALRELLGGVEEDLVEYRDMEVAGANPARIIPAWDDFATRASRGGARRLRGVGEPIWAGRSPAELAECHWHEALINRAFANVRGFWLVCPYDIEALSASVVDDARRTHPLTTYADESSAGVSHSSDSAELVPTRPLATALDQPHSVVAEVGFGSHRLAELRSLVATEGARTGLSSAQIDNLVVAVNEVATNSVTHGGGTGVARIWREGAAIVCEISDAGVITDPLVDRTRPSGAPTDARGLWTVNSLCDLVQVRSSSESGSVVRMRVQARDAGRTHRHEAA
jgi:anti-sigma regulatory factor (Ser/Thr protein kinase)